MSYFCNCGIHSKTPLICTKQILCTVGNRHFEIPEKNIKQHIDEDDCLITNIDGDHKHLWRTPFKVESVNQILTVLILSYTTRNKLLYI